MYHISAAYLARGAGAALVAGAALGGLWGVFVPFRGLFLLGLLAGLGVGYAVGEAVSQATNRKSGPPLQAMAATGVVVAYLVRDAILASAWKGIGIGDIITNDVSGMIALVIGVVVAMGRVRRRFASRGRYGRKKERTTITMMMAVASRMMRRISRRT